VATGTTKYVGSWLSKPVEIADGNTCEKKKRDLHSGKFKGGLGSWGARERWSLAFRYGQGTIATAQLRHALCSERAWRRPNGEMEHPHPCFAYATPSATPPPVHVLVPPWTSFGEQHAKERLRHFDLSSYIVFSHSFVFRPSQLTGLSSPDRVWCFGYEL